MASEASPVSSKDEACNSWFDNGPRATWEKHLLPVAAEIDRYLEIGVGDGQSMHWVLTHLEPSQAWGIDPWRPPREHQRESFEAYERRARATLKPWIESLRLTLIRESSYDFFTSGQWNARRNRIDDRSLDLAYIDGSHYGWDVIADCVHVWPLLKRGGMMIVDDHHRRFHRGHSLVRPAVEAFRLAFDGRWEIFYETRRQAAFRKTK